MSYTARLYSRRILASPLHRAAGLIVRCNEYHRRLMTRRGEATPQIDAKQSVAKAMLNLFILFRCSDDSDSRLEIVWAH
jgi:hypothetical protein